MKKSLYYTLLDTKKQLAEFFLKVLNILSLVCYIKATQELQDQAQAPLKGSEDMEDMNNAEIEIIRDNKKLDILADLVEAKAQTVAEAVEIIRSCKLEVK